MKIISSILVLSSVMLFGCGGGGSGDESGESVNPTPTVEMDGLYINGDDMTFLLVDTERKQGPIIAADYSNDEIYIVSSGSRSGDTYSGVGLYILNLFGFAYDSDKEVNVKFGSDDTATLTTMDYNNNLVSYTALKTAGSLLLTELAGNHVDPLGTEWNLNSDGSFTINGFCTISGVLSSKGYYHFAKDVLATNCSDPEYDQNNYEAVIATVEVDGENVLLGLMVSVDSNGIARGIWDYVTIE